MPDMRDSVNHLTPLKLPAQVTVYVPGDERRYGYEVRYYLALVPG
jgi:hypothetical protein